MRVGSVDCREGGEGGGREETDGVVMDGESDDLGSSGKRFRRGRGGGAGGWMRKRKRREERVGDPVSVVDVEV